MGEGNLVDPERPRLGNDVYQHPMVPQTGVATDPRDGLPRLVSAVTLEQTKDLPLDPETFLCMGDDSVFVIRDGFGQERLRVQGERARRYQDGDGEYWLVSLTDAEREQASDSPYIGNGEQLLFVMEPLRPQCEHYKRVMTDFEGDKDRRHVERVCSAQRTEGGEFVSLANTRVYACEHRSPRDFVSEERLKRYDEKLVEKAKATEEEWDADAALAALESTTGENA